MIVVINTVSLLEIKPALFNGVIFTLGFKMATNEFISKGSTILLTGANGYIASHIADQLLERGYVVRGTARDETKIRRIRETLLMRHTNAKFEGVVLPKFEDEEALHRAAQGSSAIIHCAGDLTEDDVNVIVKWSRESMESVLRVANATPSIKRVVITSSSTAAHAAQANTHFKVDASSWNIKDTEAAFNPPPDHPSPGFLVYTAGKYTAEKTAWDWVAKEKPSFTLNSVLPNLNSGPILGAWQSGSTAGWIQNLYDGDNKGLLEFFRNFAPQYFVDVRDDALLHIAATVLPDVQGQRILAYAAPYNYDDCVAVLTKYGKPKKYEPAGPGGEGKDISDVDNGPAEKLLKRMGRSGWKSLDESIKDQISYTPYKAE